MFNIHAIIILIRSVFHALDKYKIHQIQSRVLLKILNAPLERAQVQACENGRKNIAENIDTNWGGLVIQAPVNWREDLDNRISSGRVLS